jgi:hypothetical protein
MSVLRELTVGAFAITIFLTVLVEGMVVSRAQSTARRYAGQQT